MLIKRVLYGLPVVYTRRRKEQAVNGDILNLLYPMAGMFAALAAVLWRLNASNQKVWEANRREDQARWEAALGRLGGLEEQIKGVGEQVDKLDDRVRRLEPVIAVLADRANIATAGGSESALAGHTDSVLVEREPG